MALGVFVGDRTIVGRARQAAINVGELTLLFRAALRGAVRRPFYWKEFLDQCRFILTANFIPLLLTGVGWGIIVSLEAGHFFKAASSEYRLGGFAVMANIREFSPVATGLMIAAVSGTAIVADLGARQVRQELEALSVMGLSNVLFIVVPRALALMIMTALYTASSSRLPWWASTRAPSWLASSRRARWSTCSAAKSSASCLARSLPPSAYIKV
ncbi:MAG: ABC transporter permease [Chloroflexi bacterium]|nr:MAG: ABC transporter permease [Chloroflexota bacterium]